MSGLANVSRQVYNALFKRTSTFVATIVILAYPFERAFNVGTESYYRYINRGKLYDDIKDSFVTMGEEDDE